MRTSKDEIQPVPANLSRINLWTLLSSTWNRNEIITKSMAGCRLSTVHKHVFLFVSFMRFRWVSRVFPVVSLFYWRNKISHFSVFTLILVYSPVILDSATERCVASALLDFETCIVIFSVGSLRDRINVSISISCKSINLSQITRRNDHHLTSIWISYGAPIKSMIWHWTTENNYFNFATHQFDRETRIHRTIYFIFRSNDFIIRFQAIAFLHVFFSYNLISDFLFFFLFSEINRRLEWHAKINQNVPRK